MGKEKPTEVEARQAEAAVRIDQVTKALCDGVERRGHTIDKRGHWFVHGERVDCSLYERSTRRKIPLTKKELSDPFQSFDARRGWRQELVPSGWLMLVIKVDFHSEVRIAEGPRHPFKIEEILDRFEKFAAEAAAERNRRDEENRRSRRRAAERERSRHVEEARWDNARQMAKAWEDARRMRHLIDTLAQRMPPKPHQARRLIKWLRWARARVDFIDPMANDIETILARLGLPK